MCAPRVHGTHRYYIEVLATHASTMVHRYSLQLKWSIARQPMICFGAFKNSPFDSTLSRIILVHFNIIPGCDHKLGTRLGANCVGVPPGIVGEVRRGNMELDSWRTLCSFYLGERKKEINYKNTFITYWAEYYTVKVFECLWNKTALTIFNLSVCIFAPIQKLKHIYTVFIKFSFTHPNSCTINWHIFPWTSQLNRLKL
jgi:hypothetical protein